MWELCAKGIDHLYNKEFMVTQCGPCEHHLGQSYTIGPLIINVEKQSYTIRPLAETDITIRLMSYYIGTKGC